jgi:protein SCO1/2
VLRHLLCLLASLFIAALAHAQAEHSLELLREQGRDEIIPRYLLQDPYGRPVSNEDFRGRFQLIAFGYTFCPDVCPTTLVEMATLLKSLGPRAGKLQAIFITVDPERDTGKVLKTYTEFFDTRILGLTGSPQLIRRTADNFRIRYARVEHPGGGPYAVDHAAGMILLGPDGRVLRKYAFGTPTDDILTSLQDLLPGR